MATRNFAVWAMQRSGGTTFTSLLSLMHRSDTVHEPFNGRRKRKFGPDINALKERQDPDIISGFNLKHCYEYQSLDFNEALLEYLASRDYHQVLLERRDHVRRLESLALAEITGAYGVEGAARVYELVKNGDLVLPPIDVNKQIRHMKRCWKRTRELKEIFDQRGLRIVYYEDILDAPPHQREAIFEDLCDELNSGETSFVKGDLYLQRKNEYFYMRKQNSKSIAHFVPNIDEFRAAARDALSQLTGQELNY